MFIVFCIALADTTPAIVPIASDIVMVPLLPPPVPNLETIALAEFDGTAVVALVINGNP